MFHYGISPKNFDKEQKNKLRSDEILGHHIEGKFAQQQKRSHKKVIAKLSKTSTTAIAITFFMTKSFFAAGQIYLQYGDVIFHRS